MQSHAKSMGIKDFNPRNPAHAKKVLNELGYDVKNTSASVLDKIIREQGDTRFAILISRYRSLHLKQALLKNWLNSADDGRIYPRLSQLGGRSGRITCSKPNIQQVPRDPEMKCLFVASSRMSLVEADYSAIEITFIRKHHILEAFSKPVSCSSITIHEGVVERKISFQ